MIYMILAILRTVRVFTVYLFSEGIFFIDKLEKIELDSAVVLPGIVEFPCNFLEHKKDSF